MNALTTITPAPLYEVQDVWKMAQAVARSGLFGMREPEQAMALMLIAQAEGTHPALAARDYHIVDGRPTLKADAMLARFMQGGGKVEWHAYTDDAVEATFSHPQGGSVRVKWTIAQAAKIKRKGKSLTEGDNWKNYPRAMLRARVVSEGIRTVFPGCVVGVYTPEEVQDFDEPREPRNVTPPRRETATEVREEPEHVEAELVADDEPQSPQEHGLFIACKAAIDLAQDQAAMQLWAKDNEKSLAKIKGDHPEVYDAVLAYWRDRLKTLPKKTQTEPPADDFGIGEDEIPF